MTSQLIAIICISLCGTLVLLNVLIRSVTWEDVHMRTITQVAEELKVSRRKIYDENEKLGIKTIKEGRNSFVTDTDFLKISKDLETYKETFGNAKERVSNVLERDRNIIENHISDREYTDLKERITSLEEQLKMRDEQFIKQLQSKDEQIQAKDYQINGLIQSNFNFTKALNLPLEEVAVTKEVKRNIFSKFFRKG